MGARMRDRLATLALGLVVTSGALCALACATPSASSSVSACPESQNFCFDIDSDCTFDKVRQCMVCRCAKGQQGNGREGPHGPTH
jgi:hypothetical protein